MLLVGGVVCGWIRLVGLDLVVFIEVAYVGRLIVVWLVLMWLFSTCCALACAFDCWLTYGEACVVVVWLLCMLSV